MNDPGAPQGGFLLLDKPPGVSSFQALRPLKRLFRGLRVGHAGTLDPAASGLLLAGIGNGTRLLEYLEGMPKTYTFLVRFGLVSDSYDMEGEVSGAPAADLAREVVAGALPAFRGRIRQAPPAFSAVKVDGRRAYDLARAGEAVVLDSREVEVHSLELISYEAGVASLLMTCSKGTYVRSLAHDLGQALGCGALADAIRRTAIGPFKVEDAVTLERLERAAGAGSAASAEPAPPFPLLPLDTAVAHLPAAVLPAHRLAALRDGRSTAPGQYVLRPPETAMFPGAAPAGAADQADTAPGSTRAEGSEVRVLDPEGHLLAIGGIDAEGHLRPRKVLVR